MTLDDILNLAIKRNASDINITSNSQLSFRVKKELEIFTDFSFFLDSYMVDGYCESLTGNNTVILELNRPSEKDGSYVHMYTDDNNTEKPYYFRYNIALSCGKAHITIRKLIDSIPSFEAIGLNDEDSKKFVDSCLGLKEGLNLVVGATGSGKSTTLATIIDTMLSKYSIKVVTLEAPIEYYFPENKYIKNNSIIIQREVPTDTDSFANGLRAAMRQNPDVIFVGEIRDGETALAAMQAANTGHTVLATLHASSTKLAFDRLKFLVGGVTNDFSFINSIMFQKLVKSNGEVKAIRDTLINKVEED